MERVVQKVQFPDIKQKNVIRVAAYARVSTQKDAMLHSLSSQVSYYNDLIQKHPGWLYCGVYSDEAVTGTKDERAGFSKLLEECEKGNVDMVVTKSISRFARNTVTLLETIRRLKTIGVDVFFEEQNIHTLSADGELMITIIASYAQEESRSASENLKWRLRKGFESGEQISMRFLFGYRVIKSKLTVDESEALIVKEVYQRFLSGESLRSIAKDLNERGVKRPLDGAWTTQCVRNLLTNEKYTGDSLLQKTFINNHLEKKKLKNNGQLPQYYAEGTHPAIIDADTFAEVQKLFESKRKKDKPLPSVTAFSKKIKCSCCGANFRRRVSNKRKVWNCSTYIDKGKNFCSSHQIPEDLLEKITAKALGLSEFDEQVFNDNVLYIIAEKDNILRYVMRNESVIIIPYTLPSRTEYWTDEKREQARQLYYAKRSDKKWQQELLQ